MVPIQEIEIHADRNAKIIVHIEFHEEQEKFSSKAVILDRKVDPGPLGNVHFGDDHGTAMDAFEAAFEWVAQWSAARDLPVIGINNPGHCQWLSVEAQRLVTQRCGLEIPITTNSYA
jgi:hypothetical protein